MAFVFAGLITLAYNKDLVFLIEKAEAFILLFFPLFLFILGIKIEKELTKPKFIIRIGQPSSNSENGVSFLHINVSNIDWPWWFPFNRESSQLTSAKLTFREAETNKEVITLVGRWTGRSEPLNTTDIFTAVNKYINLNTSRNLDSKVEYPLDIVMVSKTNDSNYEVYAFNDDNYLENNLKLSKHKLQNINHIVEVEVFSNSSKSTKAFELIIGNQFDDVCLKEVS